MTEPAEALVRPGVVFPQPDDDAASEWLSVVHDVARQHGGRVLGGMDEPRVDRNFYAVALRLETGTATLLLNTGAGLVACVEGDRPFPPNARYIDVPSAESFQLVGLVVAVPEQMTAPMSERGGQSLQGDEAKQVRYHDPTRVGDVLFNWFD